jgi:hypothetical protein
LFLDFRDLPDEFFQSFIIGGPLPYFGFQATGNVESNRLARFFPGNEKDGMLGPLAMASTVIFSAFSGRADESPFDPGVEILDLAK